MTKIKLSISSLTIITFLMTSCGSGDKEETGNTISVKPKTIEIKGDLSDYFEVVDKEYKIPVIDNSFDQLITVEVRRRNKDFPFNKDKINPFGTSGGEEYHVGFGLELLGENGPIQVNNATEGGLGGPFSSADVSSLFKLKKGETGYIRWTVDKTEGINSFQLTSALQKEDATNSVSDDTSSESEETETVYSDTENWDNVLNDYEKYVDEYVKFYKKAKTGDATAMSEYPSLMENAQELEESLKSAQNDNSLSPKQITRMIKIQTKMLKAL